MLRKLESLLQASEETIFFSRGTEEGQPYGFLLSTPEMDKLETAGLFGVAGLDSDHATAPVRGPIQVKTVFCCVLF